MGLVTSGKTGDAYVLLEVMPGASDAVARKLASLSPSAVPYAAAVWGPWDVVARVRTSNLSDLLHFIDELRGKTEHQIIRTETWWIRPDQPQHENEGQTGRLAFVMLRVDPGFGDLTPILNYVCSRSTSPEGARVWHAAGVLGPYDIATTVSYNDDRALKKLVMEHFQGDARKRIGIKDTLTIPSIEGMVYPHTSNTPENDRPFREVRV